MKLIFPMVSNLFNFVLSGTPYTAIMQEYPWRAVHADFPTSL